jgi:hypothetical protein
MKREGKSKPQAELTKPVVGARAGRGSSEQEEQMATNEENAKKCFRPSG